MPRGTERSEPETLTCSFPSCLRAGRDPQLHGHLWVLTDGQSLPSVTRVSSHKTEIWK